MCRRFLGPEPAEDLRSAWSSRAPLRGTSRPGRQTWPWATRAGERRCSLALADCWGADHRAYRVKRRIPRCCTMHSRKGPNCTNFAQEQSEKRLVQLLQDNFCDIIWRSFAAWATSIYPNLPLCAELVCVSPSSVSSLSGLCGGRGKTNHLVGWLCQNRGTQEWCFPSCVSL